MISELHMWLTFGVIAGAMLLYVTEFVAIEMTSLLALVAMLLLFTLFPQIGPDGTNLLDATALIGRLRQSGAHHGHGVIGDGARAVSVRRA